MIQRGTTVYFYVTKREAQGKDWKKHHMEELSYNTLTEELGLVGMELLLSSSKTMNRFSNYLKLISKQGSLHRRSLHWQVQSIQLRYDHNWGCHLNFTKILFHFSISTLWWDRKKRCYRRGRAHSGLHYLFHGTVFLSSQKKSRSSFCYMKVKRFCQRFASELPQMYAAGLLPISKTFYAKDLSVFFWFLSWTDSGILWIKQLIPDICVMSCNIHLTAHNFPLS